MGYANEYRCGMSVKKRQGVQFDVDMKAKVDKIATSTGLSRTEIVRRTLNFMDRLRGIEVRELLGVNAEEIKHPDIIAILWEQLRGSRSDQSAEPGPSVPSATLPIEDAEGAGGSESQQTSKTGRKPRKKA